MTMTSKPDIYIALCSGLAFSGLNKSEEKLVRAEMEKLDAG